MSLTRSQLWFLFGVAAFFALQILPHRFTWLQHSLLVFYPLVAALLGLLIIIASAVTFLLWIKTRNPQSRLKRRTWCATFVLTLITAIGITIATAVYARGLPTGSFTKQFNQQVWATPSSSQYTHGDITERQKMLGDVIRKIVANGNKQEIIAKLGPSEDDDYFSSSGRDLIYYTGPQRDSLFPIDSEWLLIWFDSSGRTSRYEVWSD